MTTPSTTSKKSKHRKLLRKAAIVLSIMILVPITLFTIGLFNRNAIVDVIQTWYNENNSGTLSIGKVNSNFIRGFPNIGFTIKDIKHTNIDSISHKVSSLEIKEARVVIGAGNLLRGDIKFNNIHLIDAVYDSEIISDKGLEYHVQLKLDKQRHSRTGFNFPNWLNENRAKFKIENFTYRTLDTILNKKFDIEIHKVEGSYKLKDSLLAGNTSINLTINDLGFNTKKGSFFNGAVVLGNPDFTINLKGDKIRLPEFKLEIDQQAFSIEAEFDVAEENSYNFKIFNANTNFEKIKKLLPDSIVSKLHNYEILKPFDISLTLDGKFAYGNNPDIDAVFNAVNNEVILAERIHIKNSSFHGHLSNDIYENAADRSSKRSKKDIKVLFEELSGNIDEMTLRASNSYFQSTPDKLNYINANINLEGSNEDLADLLQTDNFNFEGGSFNLSAKIDGDIDDPHSFVDYSTGNFVLNSTRVTLKKNGLQLPIKTIDIDLNGKNSKLNRLIINLPTGERLNLYGEINNISGLLSKSGNNATSSKVYLNSQNLNVNEIISMAKEFVPKNTTPDDDRKNLHETIDAIYNKFNPQFFLNLNALEFNDVLINDVKSNIVFKDSETIILNNFSFTYGESNSSINGSVKVPSPKGTKKDPIYINAKAKSNGSTKIFEDLFDIQLFQIDAGNYSFNGQINGNIRLFHELLKNAKGDLYLTGTELYYEAQDKDIVIDSLALFVDNSDLYLNKFDLEIGELYPLNLTGKIEDFPSFLIETNENFGSISLKIDAPFIDGDKWLDEINSLEKNNEKKMDSSSVALYTVFKDINKFNPNIVLNIDSLKYRDLITKDINGLLYFKNDSILKLDNLNVKYKETNAKIRGEINAHASKEAINNDNPFDFDFEVKVTGKAKDLNDYLRTVNFIFKSGQFEFNGSYNGQTKQLSLLNSNAFGELKIGGAQINYRPAGIEIPIDSLHVEIDNNMATLKTLDIDLPNKSSILINGTIDNFSKFINNQGDDNQHTSNFEIYSPYLSVYDIEEFLNFPEKDETLTDTTSIDLVKFKESMVAVNTSFYPSVSINIDSLKYKRFNITEIGSKINFDQSGDFQIEDTNLNFYGGSINVNLSLGVKNVENLPVKIDIQAENVDVKEIVTRFNYFKDEDLKQTDKIEGVLDVKILGDGLVTNDGKLNLNSINGTIEVNIRNFELFNYKPLMENSIMMKDERFKNLRFRPIVQTFEIKNGEIVIPRTEIQSSAIHLFVEGKLKIDEYVDIWLSLPWKNLKKNLGVELPEKTTYEEAGSKFYVNIVQDKTSDKARKRKLKFKVKLGNRKLKKQYRQLLSD